VNRIRRRSAAILDVVGPADEEVIASLPIVRADEAEEALIASAAAQVEWAQLDTEVHRQQLDSIATVIEAHTDELGDLVCAEMGRPRRQARAEAARAAAWFRHYAAFDQRPPNQTTTGWEERRPLGLVVAITPWNYPLLTAAWKIAPALRAGNAVVLKPSPFAPLAAGRLVDLIGGVLPEGLVRAMVGGNQLGEFLVRHPVPRMVSLTGSIGAGRHVAASAASTMKRLTLELGGNDAAIVLPECEVDTVAAGVFETAFRNNGQVCTAVKRLYVHRESYEHIVDALVDRARAVNVGDGRQDDAVDLGPVANQPQLKRVDALVRASRAAGSTVLAGGERRDGSGYFYPPTIVGATSDQDPLVREEQFGPALPVVAYDSIDEAVRRANDTEFGLGGSVWGTDVATATATARRLEVGTAWVNAHGVVTPDLAFGGIRMSGLGSENGELGLESFQQVHTVRGAQ